MTDGRARLGALGWPPRVLRPAQARVWSRAVLLELGCGFERGRVIIPVRNARGGLRGVLRYAPTHDRAPKMLAVAGTRLGLIPHRASETSTWIMLVEGPPDMLSARSRGLPAIAVPGDDAWEPRPTRAGSGADAACDGQAGGARGAAAWLACPSVRSAGGYAAGTPAGTPAQVSTAARCRA